MNLYDSIIINYKELKKHIHNAITENDIVALNSDTKIVCCTDVVYTLLELLLDNGLELECTIEELQASLKKQSRTIKMYLQVLDHIPHIIAKKVIYAKAKTGYPSRKGVKYSIPKTAFRSSVFAIEHRNAKKWTKPQKWLQMAENRDNFISARKFQQKSTFSHNLGSKVQDYALNILSNTIYYTIYDRIYHSIGYNSKYNKLVRRRITSEEVIEGLNSNPPSGASRFGLFFNENFRKEIFFPFHSNLHSFYFEPLEPNKESFDFLYRIFLICNPNATVYSKTFVKHTIQYLMDNNVTYYDALLYMWICFYNSGRLLLWDKNKNILEEDYLKTSFGWCKFLAKIKEVRRVCGIVFKNQCSLLLDLYETSGEETREKHNLDDLRDYWETHDDMVGKFGVFVPVLFFEDATQEVVKAFNMRSTIHDPKALAPHSPENHSIFVASARTPAKTKESQCKTIISQGLAVPPSRV